MTADHNDATGLAPVLEDLEHAVDLAGQLGVQDGIAPARDVLAQASQRRRQIGRAHV